VPQPCPGVNPHYPRILPPALPFLPSCLDSLLLHTTELQYAQGEKKRGAILEREGRRGRIQILLLICSEKCPVERTLTPINPATGCYRCSGRHQQYVCVCVCVSGAGGAADEGPSALSAGLQHQLNLSAHYPPHRPARGADKCTLGPQAKLIHLPSFSSGSEVAAAQRQGEGAIRC